MDNAAVIWLVIFAISSVTFFVIAAVVAVKGLDDLKKLLRHSKRYEKKGKYGQ